MPTYNYTAVNQQGLKRQGSLEVSSLDVLHQQLALKGEYLLKARKSRRFINWRPTNKGFLSDFCHHMVLMLEAQVPVLEVLEYLSTSATSPQEERIFENLYMRVKNGSTLSEAMAAEMYTFNTVLLGLIKAGESRGQLAQAFGQAQTYLQQKKELHERSWRAVRYPLLLVILMAVVVAILLKVVVPELSRFLNALGGDVPPLTHALLAFAKWGPFIIGGTLTISASVLLTMMNGGRRLRLQMDHFVLKVPYLGAIILSLNLSRFFQIAALLLKNHLKLLDAAQIAKEVVDNSYLQESLTQAQGKIVEGLAIEDAYGRFDLLTPSQLRILKTGRESSNMARSFEALAQHFASEAERKSDRLISYIEPGCLMVIGLLIIWIAYAVFLPIYDQVGSLDL